MKGTPFVPHNVLHYTKAGLIVRLRDNETATIWEGRRGRKLPSDIPSFALPKLRLLNNRSGLKTFACRRAIGWKRGAANGKDSIRSPLTTNGEFVSPGGKVMRAKSRSSTAPDLLQNLHPGEILVEEFLKPMKLSQTALARAIAVPPLRRNCARQTRLYCRYRPAACTILSISEGFFIGLQTAYELMERRRAIGDKLKAIRPRAA
jgi:antitoxin HigA-1